MNDHQEQRPIRLGVALIPVIFLIGALVLAISVYGLSPHIPLVAGAAVAGIVAAFHGTPWKDIQAAYDELLDPESDTDLVQLGIEFAPYAFAPDAFAPDAFAPDAFAPYAFAPYAFAEDTFAPYAFAPYAFAPDAFAPDAFAPDAFAPDAFAPYAFAPYAFAPYAFAPYAFAPYAFAPYAFASAQLRSVIGVSAFDGTAGGYLGLRTNSQVNTRKPRI